MTVGRIKLYPVCFGLVMGVFVAAVFGQHEHRDISPSSGLHEAGHGLHKQPIVPDPASDPEEPAYPAVDRLVNYLNDSDLAKAMSYDGEYNGGLAKNSDRALAEKHYLAYLERETDSAIRARVYVQLGVLYTTNRYPKKGEDADFDRATQYLQKALEEEPDRISKAMYRARAHQITPEMSGAERFEKRQAFYEWLIEAEKGDLAKAWMLPEGGDLPTDRSVTALRNLFNNGLTSQGSNLVYDAVRLPDPLSNLRALVERFPGTPAASKAAYAIKSQNEKVNEVLGEAIESDDFMGVQPAVLESTPAVVSDESIASSSKVVSVMQADVAPKSGIMWLFWFLPLGVVLLSGACYWFVARPARKNNSK